MSMIWPSVQILLMMLTYSSHLSLFHYLTTFVIYVLIFEVSRAEVDGLSRHFDELVSTSTLLTTGYLTIIHIQAQVIK